jgi:HSP90 family molecular chaperone
MNDLELTNQLTNEGIIRVADVTIAQLSRGLYRSTATAFKELISNAYDADATMVRIDTNYPEFDFISCVDDGTGMPLEEFRKYFAEEGIGTCRKRKYGKDTTAIFNRPIIGRLGIGMLAIGQLCHSFEIECHYEDENKQGIA